jgi:hypothetical protein
MPLTGPENNRKVYYIYREESVLMYIRNQQKRETDYFIWLIISTYQFYGTDVAAYSC